MRSYARLIYNDSSMHSRPQITGFSFVLDCKSGPSGSALALIHRRTSFCGHQDTEDFDIFEYAPSRFAAGAISSLMAPLCFEVSEDPLQRFAIVTKPV